jgi:hypothetical protein
MTNVSGSCTGVGTRLVVHDNIAGARGVPLTVKALPMAVGAMLAITGCTGPEDVADTEPAPSPPAATASPTPGPPPLTVTQVGSLPTGSGVAGLALCGDHVAYVVGTSRIVLADWKAGTSRTVFSTEHSFLYAVRQVGCRLEVHDTVDGYNGENPAEPGRILRVDLRTGRVRATPAAPFDPTVVGHSGGRRVELVDGTTWRALLLATPAHVELLSSTGQVAWASMSGRHVAWVDGYPDRVPDSVHVVDVVDPDASVVLAQGTRPSAVAVGTAFVVWTAHARQFVAPAGGGPVIPVPGPRSPQNWVAAHGALLARVSGSGAVEVLRVS